MFFSHETIDASDTSASRTWGPRRPASPNTPSEASYEARNETEECLGNTMAGRSRALVTKRPKTRHDLAIRANLLEIAEMVQWLSIYE